MKATIAFNLLVLLSLCCYVKGDSQCNLGQFAVRSDKEDYLVINSPKDVQLCGVNLCNAINAKQSLSLSADGATLQISDSNSVTLQDPSPTNELQTLSLDAAGKLSISQGNSVDIPDMSSTNEIQSLSLTQDGILSISNSNYVTIPDVSQTNEIQTLSLDASGKLSISQGNSVDIPDISPTNEIQTLSLNGNSLELSNGGSGVTLPDVSATNELQNLTLSNGVLSVTNGNSVLLPDTSDKNELQNLTLTNNVLSITNGNSLDISYLSKPVLFRVSLSASLTIPQAQYTTVAFDSITVDTAQGFVAGGIYKVVTPGWYQASTMFTFHVTASSTYYIETHFYVNNSPSFHCTNNAALSGYTLLGTQCTDIFYLGKNDAISVVLWWSGSGSSLENLVGNSSWTLLKVSD